MRSPTLVKGAAWATGVAVSSTSLFDGATNRSPATPTTIPMKISNHARPGWRLRSGVVSSDIFYPILNRRYGVHRTARDPEIDVPSRREPSALSDDRDLKSGSSEPECRLNSQKCRPRKARPRQRSVRGGGGYHTPLWI